eukprot:SAG31_NODE_982_length_10556_cov_18.203883_4_plen_450_part_00
MLGGDPLRVAGREQRWVGSPGAVISGGAAVTGWKPAQHPNTEPTRGRVQRWTAPLPVKAKPKTMRIGPSRAEQVAYPSVHNMPVATQYLFARLVNATSSSREPNMLAVIVSFDLADLPNGWETWSNLVCFFWPANSWVGMRVAARPSPTDPPDSFARFILESSDGFSGLRIGNRVQFAGAPEMLGQAGSSGIWAADEHSQTVHLLSDRVPEDVWIPQQSRLVTIAGMTNLEMRGLVFTDTDFVASGIQNGFNAEPLDKGIPHDAAVAVSHSHSVTLANCSFVAPGGCGVIVGNRSTSVSVEDSKFVDIGQSGVLFVGNDTTQARECTVVGNNMNGIGTILASSGGVVISSASNISISRNQISDCARWGIAVRSNKAAGSWNNTVEQNRVERTGVHSMVGNSDICQFKEGELNILFKHILFKRSTSCSDICQFAFFATQDVVRFSPYGHC